MKHSQYLKFLTSTSRMGRGEFIKSCTKLITAGIVTRFTLLEGRVFASPEDHDPCNTVFGEQDSCNRQKQDECSGGGVPELDVCDVLMQIIVLEELNQAMRVLHLVVEQKMIVLLEQ